MKDFFYVMQWRQTLTRRRALAWTLGAAVLAAAVLMARLDKPSDAPVLGGWVAVESGAQAFELTAAGRVAPARLIELPIAANGTLEEVKVAWGDRVKQGQTLARIVSVELEAQVRTAEAAMLRARLQDAGVLSGEEPAEVLSARRRLVSAKGALQTARSRAADSETLYAKGFVSRLDRDAAMLEAENASAQLDVAEDELRAASLKSAPDQIRALRLETANRASELEQLRQRQALLQVKAPLAGVVMPPTPREGAGQSSSRELVQGVKVSAGDAVLAIGDTSALMVQANCTETDMAWLEAGLPAKVTVASLPAREFEATVARLGMATRSRLGFPGQGSPEFECEFAFKADAQDLSDEERRKLRIGGSAKVRVSHSAEARQPSIPLAAVMWTTSGSAQVRWRASAQDAATKVSVRVARAGMDDVQLREPLAGEVWVPADPTAAAPLGSFLSRMLGVEE